MTIEKKNKLIYSGEFVGIALIFLVIGILKLVDIIKFSENARLIFKILTLAGSTWMFVDFFWTALSPKRKAKECFLDKCIMLPLAVYLYAFDIYGFVANPAYEYYQIGVPIALFYVSVAYIYMGVYHYYKPVPLIVQAIQEELEEQKNKEANIENKKDFEEEKNDEGNREE